ncbi:hypothetical protein [Streptomyces cacaoi]|uniref:hypothetical protein n=1 Tax=Streptomyces cacaoi TaxID=1898 RepID=UPI00374A645F
MAIPGNMLSSTTEMIDPNTSGWTNHRNTVIALGSGGRSGPGCLAITSRGAGLMEVRTASSYPVVPGELYQVFADAAATAVPEHIGIRWLNADGTQISVTWGLYTAQVSGTWHRIGVAGRAPAGAARAHVLIGADATAGGQTIFAENVYLGLPIRTLGNLFSFNVESSELSVDTWRPEANVSISRTVPVSSWAVTWYTAGGHVLTLTAAAAGTMSALCTDRAEVTPGVDYMAHAYLAPPATGAQAWLELRYYNAAGDQIAAARGRLAAASTGWQRQRVSAVAPAEAATCAIAVGVDAAGAGQRLRVETVVATVAPQARTDNVLTYRESSFEQDTGGWQVASGAATIARSAPWGAAAYDGSYSLTITADGPGTSSIVSPVVSVPHASGLMWRVELRIYSTSGAWSLARSIRWFDADGTLISTDPGAADDIPAGGWWWAYSGRQAPDGAVQAQAELTLTAAGAGVFRVDQVALWQTLLNVEVEPHDEDAYLTITLRELAVGSLLSVYRVGPDGARTVVRGSAGLIDRQLVTGDQLVVEDYEAPIGVPVSYWIEIRQQDGTLTETRESGLATLTPGDPNWTWLKDPANPQRNMRVLVKQAPEWKQPITTAEYRVRGRPNAVIHSDVRSGAEGDLVAWTLTEAERRALTLLLSSGNTLLWQCAPGSGEDDLYVSVGEVARPRVIPLRTEEMREWTLPLTTADMPVAVGINGTSGRTWQDVMAEFATWQDVMATYATNEDLFLDRRRA